MTSEEPDYDQIAKVLAAQQQAARNAGKRRGERPRDLPSRNQIIDEFTMVSLSYPMDSHMVNTTVIGEPYHPSTASLNTLKKISIRDLKIEINHRGFYMLLRFLCPPMRMTAIMVRDPLEHSNQIRYFNAWLGFSLSTAAQCYRLKFPNIKNRIS
jgi:hypothetical protein